MNPDINKLLNKYPGLAKLRGRLASLGARQKLGLDTKQMLLVVPICLVIIIYADITTITRLQLAPLKKLKPEIIKLRKDLDAIDKGLIIMRDLRNKQKETLAKSKKIIPENQIDYILQELSIVAKNDNVKIIQMKPNKEPQAKPVKGAVAVAAATRFIPLSLNLDLVCDYHHLGKFINDLENAEMLFAVETLRITVQKDNYFQQKVDLVLKTYVKK